MDDKQAELWQKAAIANRDRADVADAAYTDAENRYEAERARADRLAAALRKAEKIIRTWHGMGIPDEAEAKAWALYRGNAPEMAPLRAALADSPKEENDG